MTGEVYKNQVKLLNLSRKNFIALKQKNDKDEINNFLHAQLEQQNAETREAHNNSLNEMEELTKFQSSTFDTIARRRLIEDLDTILELTGKIQELRPAGPKTLRLVSKNIQSTATTCKAVTRTALIAPFTLFFFSTTKAHHL